MRVHLGEAIFSRVCRIAVKGIPEGHQEIAYV